MDDPDDFNKSAAGKSVQRALMPGTGRTPSGGWAAMVPELTVSDLDASLTFWCGLLGFVVAYDRPAAKFAYLELGGAQLMLCQRNGNWETGDMRPPLGQGINLQIMVVSIAPALHALAAAGRPLYQAPSDGWYRVGGQQSGQREFLVQDPDGYLVRLAQDLGTRQA
jgi:catechol 2,3-dioxygenase-like lactoylglutathione lyase family enzyme